MHQWVFGCHFYVIFDDQVDDHLDRTFLQRLVESYSCYLLHQSISHPSRHVKPLTHLSTLHPPCCLPWPSASKLNQQSNDM